MYQNFVPTLMVSKFCPNPDGIKIFQHAGTSGVSVVGGGAASAHMAAMPGHGVEPTMQPLMPGKIYHTSEIYS